MIRRRSWKRERQRHRQDISVGSLTKQADTLLDQLEGVVDSLDQYLHERGLGSTAEGSSR